MSTLSNRHALLMKANPASAYRLLLTTCCLLLAAYFFPLHSASIVIDGKTYTIDTLSHFKVGPGTQYTSLRLQSNNRLDVFFLKVDAANPYVSFKAVLGRDSIYTGEQPSAMAKRKSKDGAVYFAGSNGDFYVTQGYVGYPIAGCMVEGEVARIPTTARKVIAFDQDKLPTIGAMSYSGSVKWGTSTWNINGVNHLREENQLVLFNQHNGKITRTNAFGTEVLLQLLDGYTWGVNKTVKAKVISKEQNKGAMAIPKGHAVLSGHGTAAANLNLLSVNDEVEIALNLNMEGLTSSFTEVIGGDNRNPMLKDGVVETAQVWDELHPRTGIGYSQDKKTIYYCVVDGRGASAGVTTKQLAQIMKSAGAHTAFNMDGGGSSSLYVKDFGPMNTPSDGTERAVSNGIFAVSSAPADNVVSAIESYETTIKLPRYGIFKPKFLGYNQYGMLINKDVQGVTLSCDAALGYINEDGFFVASGTSNGVLTASYNGIQTNVNIKLVLEAVIAIRLDSLLIDNYFEYPVEVQSVIGLNTMKLLPSALTWIVRNPDICSVDNGILKGLKNGTTYIVGNLGAFKDSIRVKVEIPTAGRMAHDTFSDFGSWTLTSSSSTWNTTLETTGLPAGWTHGAAVKYTFKSTRSPFIKLTKPMSLYSLPDTIKLVMNTGNADISNLIVGLRANNQASTVSVSFANIAKGKDVEVSIPATQVATDVRDIHSFPLRFEYFSMYLNASAHVDDTSYSIYLKEIALRYKNITLGLQYPGSSWGIQVYPNPVDGNELTVRLPEQFYKPVTISIYSISGKQMGTWHYGEGKTSGFRVSVSGISAGAYLLKVKQDGKEETIKFLKH